MSIINVNQEMAKFGHQVSSSSGSGCTGGSSKSKLVEEGASYKVTDKAFYDNSNSGKIKDFIESKLVENISNINLHYI